MGHNEKEFSTEKLVIHTAITSNSNLNLIISNVAPPGVTTSSISGWLPIIVKGVEYFTPLWT